MKCVKRVIVLQYWGGLTAQWKIFFLCERAVRLNCVEQLQVHVS